MTNNTNTASDEWRVKARLLARDKRMERRLTALDYALQASRGQTESGNQTIERAKLFLDFVEGRASKT